MTKKARFWNSIQWIWRRIPIPHTLGEVVAFLEGNIFWGLFGASLIALGVIILE